MLKNYEREYITIREYTREFTYKGRYDNAGFTFPCDEKGNLLPDLTEAAKANYARCMATPERFSEFNHFTVRVRHETRPHGTCSCGNEVELYDQYYGACQCAKCGSWYNLFGQELLPPDQWETDPSEEEYYGWE